VKGPEKTENVKDALFPDFETVILGMRRER
jgi:hypothetical protein